MFWPISGVPPQDEDLPNFLELAFFLFTIVLVVYVGHGVVHRVIMVSGLVGYQCVNEI